MTSYPLMKQQRSLQGYRFLSELCSKKYGHDILSLIFDYAVVHYIRCSRYGHILYLAGGKCGKLVAKKMINPVYQIAYPPAFH